MKLFVDENIPSRTVEELRALGHDVLDIRGTPDQGMEDDVWWARCYGGQAARSANLRGLGAVCRCSIPE